MTMTRLLAVLACICCIILSSCQYQRQCAQARESKTVVLDIGHYYHPKKGGRGARTPDNRYGMIEELDFWYRYVIYTKKVIEEAGYTCIICNRGETPKNKKLAAAGKKAGVVQLNTPVVTGAYRSRHNPHRIAVGMWSADYALDQKPACVVFLHHNSRTNYWMVYNGGLMYCNEVGSDMAFAMAKVMNDDIFDKGMPNNGVPCGVMIRNNGRLGGGDWLNTCQECCVPAVITESAFLSNPEHAKFLGKHKNAIRYAEAVGKGIVNYLNAR